jgi:hypothetical protein
VPSRRRLYRLASKQLQPLHDWVAKYEQAINDRLDRIEDYLTSCNDKETTVTPDGMVLAVITFPNELEVVITREFDAPDRSRL